MAASVPIFTLNDGQKIPSIGIGCWMGTPGESERAYRMVLLALKHGYRHIDTAAGYGNEEAVGRAIRDSGVPREEIYLVSKLPNQDHHRVKESFDSTLKALGTHLDLYLIHWPQAVLNGKTLSPDESPTYIEVWQEMEKLLTTGQVKSIGVSNFSIKLLNAILEKSNVVPAVNQVELHPCLPQEDLKQFCDSKGILVTAYSSLGRSTFLHDEPLIAEIANTNKISTAQVLLSWAVQRGIAVIPKSETDERIKSNIEFHKLPQNDLQKISLLHKEAGKHRSLLTYHKEDGSVFGWTYEQLGWPLKTGGFAE